MGLAATAVALLAGRDASDVVDPHRPGAWRRDVTVEAQLGDLLEEMLQVDAAQRPTAADVRRRIEALEAPAPPPSSSAPRPAATLADVRARAEGRRRETWRDVLVKIGHDPVGQAGWLGFISVVLVLLVYALALIGVDVAVLSVGAWVGVIAGTAVVAFAGVAVVGARLERDEPAPAPAVRRALRLRKLRRFLRRTLRSQGWWPLVFALILGLPLAMVAGTVSASSLGSFAPGAIAVGAALLLDQLQAALRGRHGWRRMLGAELDAVWPRGSEERRLFVQLANAVWCSSPGIAAKSSTHQAWGALYAALGAMAETDVSAAQREHIELVLLVCHASFADGERFEASLAVLDRMQPRRATVEALAAAIDEADDHQRALNAAERWGHERQRASAGAR